MKPAFIDFHPCVLWKHGELHVRSLPTVQCCRTLLFQSTFSLVLPWQMFTAGWVEWRPVGSRVFTARAVLSVSEASRDPLRVPAVFACWQQRQARKMGARRDDMWQRLHARLAGTRQACESSGLLQHCQTLLFIALGLAPENKQKKKIITSAVWLRYVWEDLTFLTFWQFWRIIFSLTASKKIYKFLILMQINAGMFQNRPGWLRFSGLRNDWCDFLEWKFNQQTSRWDTGRVKQKKSARRKWPASQARRTREVVTARLVCSRLLRARC